MRDGYEQPERKGKQSKYVPSEASSCTRKSPYETEAQVLAFKAVYERERNIKLGHYKCRYCGMWHLTSQNRK